MIDKNNDKNNDSVINLLDLNIALNNNAGIDDVIRIWNSGVVLYGYDSNDELTHKLFPDDITGLFFFGYIIEASSILNISDINKIIGTDRLEIIGQYTFQLQNISIIDFSGCSNLKEIGYGAFYGCFALTNIDFTNCTDLSSIGSSAFEECNTLTNLDFTTCISLNKIVYAAFAFCRGLTNVNFTNCTDLTSIGGDAFYKCSALKSVDFTNCTDLSSIGGGAFQECSDLLNLDFSGCHSLNFDSFDNITTVFLNCTKIKTVNVTNSGLVSLSDASLNSIFKQSSDTNPINYIGILPYFSIKLYNNLGVKYESSDVSNIPNNLYNSDTSINHVIGGSLLETIGDYAFKQCTVLKSVNFTNCTELSLINNFAFDGCTVLKSLDFTGCSKLIFDNFGDTVFDDCSNIQIVNVTNSGLVGLSDASLNSIFKKGQSTTDISYI
tara:strand:+ start:4022 stop:5335 length:1314 start_codon:yes stop_codon:yes gene_type:complete